MTKFKEKLAAFFYGRYGVDQLYRFLLGVWLVLAITGIVLGFFEGTAVASMIVSILTTLLIVYMFFRVLSKNIVARRVENNKYMAIRNKVVGWFKLQLRRFKERKTHSFKKCPHCKKTVRLRKIKGEHTVLCPLCKGTFKVKF